MLLDSTYDKFSRSKSLMSKSHIYENKSSNDFYNQDISIQKSNMTINQDFLMSNNNQGSHIGQDQKNYINDLLRKLQVAKEERKLAEKNSKILEHRVVLLMNQEKLVKKI